MLFSDDYFSYQTSHPRFQAENLDKNKNIYIGLKVWARSMGALLLS